MSQVKHRYMGVRRNVSNKICRRGSSLVRNYHRVIPLVCTAFCCLVGSVPLFPRFVLFLTYLFLYWVGIYTHYIHYRHVVRFKDEKKSTFLSNMVNLKVRFNWVCVGDI